MKLLECDLFKMYINNCYQIANDQSLGETLAELTYLVLSHSCFHKKIIPCPLHKNSDRMERFFFAKPLTSHTLTFKQGVVCQQLMYGKSS